MSAKKSIRKQAQLVSGSFLAIVALLAVFSFGGVIQSLNQASAQEEALNRFHTQVAPLALSARQLQMEVIQVQQYFSDVSATRGENGLDDGFNNAAKRRDMFLKTQQQTRALAEGLNSAEALKDLDNVAAAFPPYYDTGLKMAKAYVSEGTSAGNRHMEEFDQKAANMTQSLENLMAVSERLMAADRADAAAAAAASRSTAWVVSAVLLVVAALGLALALFMGSHIKKVAQVLQGAGEVMNRAARGDLNARIIRIERDDEIGMLLVSVNRVLDLTETFAKEIGAAMAAAQRKEYFRYIPEEGLRGDFLRFVRAINTILASMESRDAKTIEFETTVKGMVDEVAASTKGISGTANMMAHRSEATGGRSLDVGEAAQATTARAEVVSEATRQLVASINEIASQATQSSLVARRATEQISATSARMDALAQAISQIGQVVGLINTIAGQTNLLALNATIEAARAGEAGRGFAVVANEVKNLANQTATATGTITGQVEAVQSAAREAIDAIADIVHTIESIEGISAAIAGAVQQQEASTQEISRNIEGVVQEADHVSTSVSQLSQSSAHSCAGTVRVIWSARKLASVVNSMHDQVTRYIQSVS
ncbi:Methyl-accepting chemotaxis protein [Magnetospirillum gryphiswaldense MSR-1 v2]|uniref:Methyl-accepting chemotaxis protein n=1 Tax=Magnetospirillum gryphiswaldense (strain DSM 6361 / JCM 21280 / NBRC 15271 / MSR-1) TaxID=431944 RepID=V6F125_MAGGM|nr:HAMP domain-containing methyl-accepting chemotaxis protein [Magnetospirillum gryphiswaldense]CDK99092.1 Methyl-accepting chemotaxis protein [Magnetospirillum gryphiswaldense MSR-1 v2]